MMEVRVKTLDSQNHSFSVSDDSTVKEFKEQIAPVLGITAEKQRLIFCGRVLQDDKKLSEYDVNGKVIHVVQRLPPQPQGASSSSSSSTSTSGGTTRSGHLRDGSSFVLGAFTIPPDIIDPTHVQNIVQDVVSGMGEIGRNATVMSRTSDDGSSVDVHINLGQVPLQSEAQIRINHVQSMLVRASRLLESLESASGAASNLSESSAQSDNGNSEDDENRNTSADGNADRNAPARSTPVHTQTDSPLPSSAPIRNASSEPSLSVGAVTTNTSETNHFGEGLAQAARAAVTAAVAAAASAAAASLRVSNNTSRVAAELLETVNREFSPELENLSTRETSSEQLPSTNASSGSTATGTGTSETQSTVPAECSTTTSQTSVSTNTTSTSSTTTTNRSRREIVQPRVEAMANLLEEVISVSGRLMPVLQQCIEHIRANGILNASQATESQNLYNRTTQLLHFLSHAFHSLSDLYVNFNQSPPRSLRVRIVTSSSSPAFFHASGVPVQAQINISSPNNSFTFSSSTTTSSTSTTTSASRTASTTAPGTTTTTTASSVPTTSSIVTETTPSENVSQHHRIPAPPLVVTRGLTANFPPTSVSSASSALGSQNPLVFVEMGSTGININNITSSTTSSNTEAMDISSPPTTTTASASAPIPPPRATSTAATNPSSRNRHFAESQSGQSRSTSHSSTTPSSGHGQPVELGSINLRNFNPIPVPLTHLSPVSTFDPNLPCNSVWALEPSRRRHPATSVRQAHVGISPNVQGRQEDQLHNVISGLMTSLFNNPLRGASHISVPSSSFAVFSGSSSDTASQRRESANSEQSASASSQSTQSSSNQSRQTPVTDDWFSGIIQGITNQLEHGQSRVTVAEFLYRLDDTEYMEGQNIFMDLFMCIARETTFQDLVSVFFGSAEPLTRMRTSFQTFVREKVLNNDEATEENINKAINNMISQLKDLMDIIITDANIRPDIDYEETLNKFFHLNFRKLINAVLNTSEISDASFGSHLYTLSRTVLTEFIALNIYCFSDGALSAERVARSRIDSMTAGMNIIIRQWMQSIINHEIHSSNPSTNVPVESLQPYLVYKRIISSPESPCEDEVLASNSVERVEISSTPSEMSTVDEPLEGVTNTDVEMPEDDQVHKNKASPSDSSRTESDVERNGINAAAVLSTNERMSENDSQRCEEVVFGSENWHNAVPREWVPIITRDLHRQRRQAPQAPFSDAYLNGMPSKRRKVMTNGVVNSLMGPVQNILPESIVQAISSAGVQPRTSIEQIKREASQDASLHTAFKEQVKCAVQERLRSDMDYCPDRFPNTEQYFNK